MCIEESPPVEKIVKKIDFKDSSMTGSGSPPTRSIPFLHDRTSELLSKQRNDSKQTLLGVTSNAPGGINGGTTN